MNTAALHIGVRLEILDPRLRGDDGALGNNYVNPELSDHRLREDDGGHPVGATSVAMLLIDIKKPRNRGAKVLL